MQSQNSPTHSPMVSVIIPTYNHAHYLGQAIQSVLDQEYRSFEILVIDDGSADNSREVACSFEGNIQYIWQENQGLSAARNTGILASQGEFIGLLDADDQWRPNYLATLVPVLAAGAEIGAVYSGWRYMDAQGNDLPQASTKTVPPEQFINTLAFMNFLVPSGVLFRRECFDRLGGFDRALRAVEDRDMWLRIATRYRVVGVPQVLVRYRTHGANMTKDLQRMEEARRAVIAKNFGREEGDARTWPDIRRRAYGGLYLRTALDHFELGEVENGHGYLRDAFTVYPELAENLEAFYELGCAHQPRGFRGILGQEGSPEDARFLIGALDKIFESQPPESLESRKSQAYAYAHFAAGLLAYRRQDAFLARNYLVSALRLYPGLVRHPQLLPTLAKTLLGERAIRLLKRSADNGE